MIHAVSVEGSRIPTLQAVVTGTVEEIRGPNRYAFNLQGVLLELELDFLLALGDRVSFRVREQTPARLVLEPLPSEAPAAPAPAPQEIPEELREVAGEFRRMGAPLEPDLMERAARASKDGPTRRAAAFLASRGFEPSGPMVESLARLSAPPPPPETSAELLAPLARALEERVSDSPAAIPGRAAKLAGPPPDNPLARLLASSPRLQVLDRFIDALTAATPAEAPPQELPARLGQALKIIREAAPETIEQAVRSLPALSRDGLREILGRLFEFERNEILSLPGFAAARAAPGTVLDAAERLADLRFVNQASLLRNEGIAVLEIPVRADGRLHHVLMRVRREERQAAARPGPRTTVALDLELSKLGRVQALLDASGRSLAVRLRTPSRPVKSHLESRAGELAGALRAQGFEPGISAETGAVAPAAPLDAFEAADGSGRIDIRL